MTTDHPEHPDDRVRALRRARAELRAAVACLLGPGTDGQVPLLHQLGDAIAASTGGRGGGGRVGGALPMNASVLDLATELDRWARANLWRAETTHRVGAVVIESAPVAMSTAERIRRTGAYLVHREQDPARVSWVAAALRYWARQITGTLTPTHKALAVPCPACEARWATDVDAAGEIVRVPVLRYVPGVGTTCLACQHRWPAPAMDG